MPCHAAPVSVVDQWSFTLLPTSKAQVWPTPWLLWLGALELCCTFFDPVDIFDPLNIFAPSCSHPWHITSSLTAPTPLHVLSLHMLSLHVISLHMISSLTQDPSGAYIKRWVPELSALPGAHVHEPWGAPPDILAASGVVLGQTYPHRCAGSCCWG